MKPIRRVQPQVQLSTLMVMGSSPVEGVLLGVNLWLFSPDGLHGMGSSPVEGVLLGVNLWLYSPDGLHGLEG